MRERRASPPTDTDDDDPFHFDSVLSSSPTRRKADTPGHTLSSLLLRRASIIPVDPTAAPAPHRFSLLRERASEETIFVQEICDAEGRRWSLRVPASGLPEDMVHMLEELEKLAVELGQALPRIVVTCSAESLSLKRKERLGFGNPAGDSTELLRPPPAAGDEVLVGREAGTGGRSLAKEKRRLVENEHISGEPARPPESSSIGVSSASEQSLTCIYLPEVSRRHRPPSLESHGPTTISLVQLAPEFLSGSSTSPVLQPAHGFHSKPVPAAQCPRQRAFFSALKEPQPTSGIAKRIMSHMAKTEPETGAAAVPDAALVKSKSRTQTIKTKSALPVLKTNSNSKASAVVAAAAAAVGKAADVDERRRARLASLSESPPQEASLRSSGAASGSAADHDHASKVKATGGAATTMTMSSAGVGAGAGAKPHHQHYPALASLGSPPPMPPSQQPPDRRGPAGADALRAASALAPAAASTGSGRKLRQLFRRPPMRSVSDPPLYSHTARPVTDKSVKRPVSEVVPAPREVVVERRMPRLPSARDLLRKLT